MQRVLLVVAALLVEPIALAGDKLAGFEVGTSFKPTKEWDCSGTECKKPIKLGEIDGTLAIKSCNGKIQSITFFKRYIGEQVTSKNGLTPEFEDRLSMAFKLTGDLSLGQRNRLLTSMWSLGWNMDLVRDAESTKLNEKNVNVAAIPEHIFPGLTLESFQEAPLIKDKNKRVLRSSSWSKIVSEGNVRSYQGAAALSLSTVSNEICTEGL